MIEVHSLVFLYLLGAVFYAGMICETLSRAMLNQIRIVHLRWFLLQVLAMSLLWPIALPLAFYSLYRVGFATDIMKEIIQKGDEEPAHVRAELPGAFAFEDEFESEEPFEPPSFREGFRFQLESAITIYGVSRGVSQQEASEEIIRRAVDTCIDVGSLELVKEAVSENEVPS